VLAGSAPHIVRSWSLSRFVLACPIGPVYAVFLKKENGSRGLVNSSDGNHFPFLRHKVVWTLRPAWRMVIVDCYALTLTLTAFEVSALGSVIASTPSLYWASTFLASTSAGRLSCLLKAP